MASRPKTSSFLTLTEVLDAIDGFDNELQFGEEDDFDMDIITTELDEDDELEEIESGPFVATPLPTSASKVTCQATILKSTTETSPAIASHASVTPASPPNFMLPTASKPATPSPAIALPTLPPPLVSPTPPPCMYCLRHHLLLYFLPRPQLLLG